MFRRQQDKVTSESLYAKHAKILGIEGPDVPVYSGSDKSIQDEMAGLDRIDLPELQLPNIVQRKTAWPWLEMAVAAGLCGLMIWGKTQWDGAEDLRQKGAGSSVVQIHFQRGDLVLSQDDGKLLQAGDFVRVALTPARSGLAALLFFNDQNKLLSPLTGLDGALKSVTAGQPFEFPGSVQLTGVSEGEKVVVLICSETASQRLVKEGPKTLESLVTQALTVNSAILRDFDCELRVRILRAR